MEFCLSRHKYIDKVYSDWCFLPEPRKKFEYKILFLDFKLKLLLGKVNNIITIIIIIRCPVSCFMFDFRRSKPILEGSQFILSMTFSFANRIVLDDSPHFARLQVQPFLVCVCVPKIGTRNQNFKGKL